MLAQANVINCGNSTAIVLLEPDLAQCLDCRDSAQFRRCVLGIHEFEYCVAITSNSQRHLFACLVRFWQTIVLESFAIALNPCDISMEMHPVWSSNCKFIEGMAERFTNVLNPLEGTNSAKDMGGVSALLASCLEEPFFT